ncbi:unnamed protein product [Parnassius mnemosyne]|uniref:Uncharacterized protein n=1 Tax=Parnassius mnemosyne TaxID=213953 RepID=A0AAV1M521_9NEOP
MPLTAAERQRRYKEKLKLNSEKYEEYKTKKRVNYHTKKRLIKDLTPQEKYNARTIWRLRKKNLRQNRKNLNHLLDITPPSSSSILIAGADAMIAHDAFQNSPHQNDDDTDISGINSPQNMLLDKNVSRKSRGQQKIRRDRSKLYRENLKLREENEKLKQKYEKYKKRCQRNKHETMEKDNADKTTKYIKLSGAIKERYQKTKKHKDKKILKDIFECIDDCEKKVMVEESLGITGKIRTSLKVKSNTTELMKIVETFYLRDVSRPTAGKKETITRQGQKLQKRFLLETMKNLYKTFKAENPNTKCSYYYFTKNKPFYVVKPSVSGREMCLCKMHTNPVYKARALKNKGIINNDSMSHLIAATVCNPKEQACMYGTCNQCCSFKISSDVDKDTDKIQWKEWVRVEEAYEKDGKRFKAFKNIKKDKEGTSKALLAAFNEELKLLKKHVYNMKVQFINFRQAIENLQQTEVVIVADFSENYCCKHHEEIQAHHFGGSRLQVSLHTVVVYILTENNKKVESYCTVSSNTNHQPAAIWAHLSPVLKDIRSSYPDISTVHFFTDGPFSQYRQKQNFYLGSTALFDHGFKAMTWSFFEAGHGKGPADGIGGYLKRSADDLVARGKDISCTDNFYYVLKDVSKIKLYLIASKDIEAIAKQLPSKIQPLPGTKNVHQIFTTGRGQLKYRILSCFCSRGFCECLAPKAYRSVPLVTEIVTTDRDNNQAEVEAVNAKNNGVVSGSYANEKSVDKNMPCSSKTCEVPISSEEDLPLSHYKVSAEKSPLKEIELIELSQAHNKNWYQFVYKTPETSDDEPVMTSLKPKSSTAQLNKNKGNQEVRQGDFLLVNVHATKGKLFKYACVVDDLHEDGEIRVTFLRSVNKKNTFRLEKSDVADIDYTDIIEILAEPIITTKRGQQYYIFEYDVHVLEK